MPTTQLFVTFVVLGLFGGYSVWMTRRSKKAVADMGPVMQAFFAQTGYRYADMPPEPMAAHVQRAVAEAQNWTPGDRVIRYVRNFHGIPITFEQSYRTSPQGFSQSCSWRAPLPAPPRIPFHVADRSLDSVGKAVREAFSHVEREFHPRYPQRVETGNPEVDRRFLVFGHDPQAVRWLFTNCPALVSALGQCSEVDLWVDAHSVVFSDPSQKNITAALGGTVGQMALGFDMQKRTDMTLPVHERICEILAFAVRASSGTPA